MKIPSSLLFFALNQHRRFPANYQKTAKDEAQIDQSYCAIIPEVVIIIIYNKYIFL